MSSISSIKDTIVSKPKPVGWISRVLGFPYRPRTAYDINPSMTVFGCASFEWPVLASTGGGEHHVWRMSRSTTEAVVEFISSKILLNEQEHFSKDAQGTGCSLIDELFGGIEAEYRPGDGLKIWKSSGSDRWHLAKTSVGMPRLTLKYEEWHLLKAILCQILHDTEIFKSQS
jgi:hypothetical protein